MLRVILKQKITGRVIMPISCGFTNSYQEIHYLQATIAMFKEHTISYDVVLTDTLQRHTLAMRGIDNAEHIAKDLGNQWMSNNGKYLTDRVIRWDDLRSNESFNRALDTVRAIYNKDSNYRTVVIADANSFIKRYEKRFNLIDPMTACRNYIWEETAMLMSQSKNYKYIIYPGSLPTSLDYIRKGYHDLPEHNRIYFKVMD